MKRDRLISQLEEAKHLKEDIDRRGSAISKILHKMLTIEEFADFDYFINMKAKLLVDSAEISNKIKLGEEQLSALKETLVHSECWPGKVTFLLNQIKINIVHMRNN